MRAAKTFVHSVFRRLGLVVRRLTPIASFDCQRNVLLNDMSIDLVLDGGANSGHYARNLRRWGFRNRIASFEPGSAAFRALAQAAARDPEWDAHQVAVGDRNDTAQFNVSGNSVSSSLLNPIENDFNRQAGAMTVATELIDVVRLDDFVPARYPASRNLFLKLDVQGYEMIAIAGAAGIMDNVRMIELEIGLVPLYEGVEDWIEVLSKMRATGYELAAIEPNTIDRHGRTMEVNGIFVQEDRVGPL